MIPRERQNKILAHLDSFDVMTVEQAMAVLQVSPATVRRDFNDLARKGLVERNRGGIGTLREVSGGLLPFGLRNVQQSAEKAAIARRAAEELQEGDTVMIDGGTTTFHLAPYLAQLSINVITNSVRLAASLDEHRVMDGGPKVILTGGHLHPRSGVLIGPQAAASLTQYHAKYALLSGGGINEEGIFNTDEFVVESERTMIARAEKTIVLADHSKVGHRSMCPICPLEDIDILVTDAYDHESEILHRLAERGVQIEIVNPIIAEGAVRRDAERSVTLNDSTI